MKYKTKLLPARQETEVQVYIWSISHSLINRTLEVFYGPGETINDVVTPVRMQSIRLLIQNDDYAELMTASPDWALLKPADTFRAEDLLEYVDILQQRMIDRELSQAQEAQQRSSDNERLVAEQRERRTAERAAQKAASKAMRLNRKFNDKGELIEGKP